MDKPTPQELNMMPRLLGEIFYPHGQPPQAIDVLVNGKSVVGHLATPHPDSLEICRQWMIYYLSAPVWLTNPHNNSDLEQLITLARKIQSPPFFAASEQTAGWEKLTELIYKCLDIGIDPF